MIRSVLASDLAWRLSRSPGAMLALAVLVTLLILSLFAPVFAPQNPFDLATLDLFSGLTPPVWREGGRAEYFLGTDEQGRDLWSAILYGMRISLAVGLVSVVLSMVVGVAIGLIAGTSGGWVDTVLMRVADAQLALPAILVALLIDGAARAVVDVAAQQSLAIPVLIFSIALSGWVQYARAVRAAAMVEMRRDYVSAARLLGLGRARLLIRHVMPNSIGAVFVLATVHVAAAVVTEATLIFLGVGMPPTVPSLGTLIRNGYDFLFSGEWWVSIFPGCALVLLVFAVNVLGDWLRDTLNPRLQ